jgi:aquaporin Z
VKQWQRYLAELFGTFILVFGGTTGILAALRVVDAAPWNAAGGSGANAVELIVPFAFGLALMAGLYAFAEVSGGHFNPAVSLGLFLDRRLTFEDLLGYWIFQFAGAILASLLMLIPFNHDLVKATATQPSSNGTALFIEITFTAIFVLVILHSTKSDRFGGSALVAIPLTLLAIHFAAIPFSGSSVNPARSLGPALVGDQWHAFWIYVVGPAAGAVIAWIVYTVVIKGDTDLRDDMQRIRNEVRPPSTPASSTPPPTSGDAAPPTG